MGNVFSIKSIKINEKNYNIPSPDKLKYFFDQLNNIEYKEIDFEGNNNSSLLIVMNKNKSLCIFWENIEEDITYHSLNKNGKKGITEKFIISNGQEDEYDDIYLIENEKIYKVIEDYYINGIRSESIYWEKD
jgi:hypothetical protein